MPYNLVAEIFMKIGLIIATEEEFDTLVKGFNVKPEEEKDDNKVNGKKDGSDDEKEKEDEEEIGD